MSGRFLVILPVIGSALRWRSVDLDGATTGTGVLTGDAPIDIEDGMRVTAIVPGSTVAVHWVEMPKASAAQAAAAARHMASDFVAGPVEEQHVAAATSADEDGMRAIGIASRTSMQHWLEVLSRYGLDPDDIVPAPLLLPALGDTVSTLRSGDMILVRGPRMAIEAEASLADMVIGARKTEALHRDILDLAGLVEPEDLEINLRQGEFRKRIARQGDEVSVRRLCILAAACLLVFLGTRVVELARYQLGANAMQAEVKAIARRTLPDTPIDDAPAQLNARLRSVSGFSGTSAVLFAALQASGNIRLEALRYSADSGMRATLAMPAGASLDSVRARLAENGLGLVEGANRNTETGMQVDVEVNRQ